MKFDKLMELHADDLVYRTITAFEAPSTVVTSEFEGAFVTPQTFPVYSLDRSTLLPGYMALLTTSPTFHEDMSSRCVGTVLRRKTLSKGAFESIPIALPPLVEQRRVVDLIAAVDDAIEAAEGEALSAARLLNSVLDAAGATTIASIGSVAAISSGASWVKADVQSSADAGDPVLTIANTKPDGTVTGAPTYVAGLSAKTGRLTASSIVAIRTNGNHDRIGNVYRAPDEYLGAAVSAFQLIVEPFIPEDCAYLYWMMRRPIFQSEITRAASGSTGLGNIAATKLREMTIAWPEDANDRTERVLTYEELESSRAAARAHADALHTLRSNLLTVLLSGEHEIPSSYDQFLSLDEEAAA
ncbi:MULTISPECIES: hypothetical protein [unclassified Microbacterium]|nr:MULTISPECIES: hypothetical protein [unclassified Microbacterium]